MKDNKGTTGHSRLLELDALRGAAALFVVLFHFTKGFTPAELGFNNYLLHFGATGVELFFIISGFVIFMSITKLASGKEFIINRIARLYPTYWATVVFTFLVIVFTQMLLFHKGVNTTPLAQFLVNLSMFQYYFNVKDLDGPYWTLIIEIIFYIYIYILFISKTIKYIEKISFALLASTVLIYAGRSVFANYNLASHIFGLIPLLPYFPLFYSGIIFYKMFTEKETLTHYLVLAVCFCAQLYLFTTRGLVNVNIYEYAVILLTYYGLFVLFIKNKIGFIVTKQTVFLGYISYALYVVHNYVSASVVLPALVRRLHVNFILAGIIQLAFVIALAYLITKYIDVPNRNKFRNYLRKKFIKS
ncbi:hypothetical protein CJD36_018505 [Flavipsychrobacter stenotrophus]|uniref:Acyltransferase 3 domain-containing protein n=1 Tax=Flavipsychrobacter stenotrophus TaxID=2077091 RepID=A0A2S7SQR5_9BACT|nr:acyltransferase [Flavipsychrobacter stenotrophus]PQJ09243.1 hypothetical protein CJD36_018505 [Flavipsychrobacter stenotrophus]